MDEQNTLNAAEAQEETEVKTEQTQKDPAVSPVISDEQAAEEERLRKYREKEEKAAAKEAEKERLAAEKEARVREKLTRDMEKHYERKAKADAEKAKRDARRIERDRIDKEKNEAKKEAARVYYTQEQLGELLANRNPVMIASDYSERKAAEEAALKAAIEAQKAEEAAIEAHKAEEAADETVAEPISEQTEQSNE